MGMCCFGFRATAIGDRSEGDLIIEDDDRSDASNRRMRVFDFQTIPTYRYSKYGVPVRCSTPYNVGVQFVEGDGYSTVE